MDTPATPPRHPTHAVRVRNLTVGGSAPVAVQSMTNTDTADEVATAIQVAQLHRAGSALVRITVNTVEAAAAVPGIRERLAAHLPTRRIHQLAAALFALLGAAVLLGVGA